MKTIHKIMEGNDVDYVEKLVDDKFVDDAYNSDYNPIRRKEIKTEVKCYDSKLCLEIDDDNVSGDDDEGSESNHDDEDYHNAKKNRAQFVQ